MSDNYDFKCRILEIRRNWRGADIEHINSAYVTIHEDNIELRKKGLVIKSDLGTTNFYYNDISSMTYDKPGLFHTTSNININLYSGEKFVLQKVKVEYYEQLHEKWEAFKKNPQKTNNVSSDSLLKYAELYKEDLITEEEFKAIKQKLIGIYLKIQLNFVKTVDWNYLKILNSVLDVELRLISFLFLGMENIKHVFNMNNTHSNNMR